MTPNKFQHAGLEWIPHTPGDPMPCADDTRVRVLLRNLKQGKAEAWVGNWAQIPGAYGLEIIGWHPIEEQPEPDLIGILSSVADFAHAGGLVGLSAEDALRYVRVLTLKWFNQQRSREVIRLDIEQAKHELKKELE